MELRHLLATLALTAALSGQAPKVRAAETEPASLEPAVREEVSRLIQSLNADDFTRRDRAAQRLAELAGKAEHSRSMSIELRQAMLAPGASFEVRAHLREILKNLPAGMPAPVIELTDTEIDRLLDALNSDSYAVRLGASEKLDLLLANPKLICPVVGRFKRRLVDAGLSPQARRQLEPAWDKARGAWLACEECDCRLPVAGLNQLDRWIQAIQSPALQEGKSWPTHEVAQRELIDLLIQDDCREKVAQRLAKAIEETNDPAAEQRLRSVYEWTQPAMVAEIWSAQHHVTIQYLLVDVPQFPEGGLRATHFDHIDEQTAHCVSGNSLTPGDYPVGVAIPHPEGREVMFHLQNLPTPRRRLAYTYRVKRDEPTRLKELSQRSMDKLLADKRSMSELEIVMLVQLDSGVISRFAGPYFQAVDDQPLPRFTSRVVGQTCHTALCYMLAVMGTRDAVPGLEQAVAKKRIARPDAENPYHMPWIAAMAIARRDPWQGMDQWLAGIIDRAEPLVANADSPPDLGATAAAMLLDRREVSTRPFGLEAASDAILERVGIAPYRFRSPEGRKDVLRWWDKQQKATAEKEAS